MQKSALLKQSDVDVASVAKLQYETAYTIWGFLSQLLKQLRGQPLVLLCFLGFDLITCQYPFHTTLQAWAVNCDRTSIREYRGWTPFFRKKRHEHTSKGPVDQPKVAWFSVMNISSDFGAAPPICRTTWVSASNSPRW